jgi:hypothetical protein
MLKSKLLNGLRLALSALPLASGAAHAAAPAPQAPWEVAQRADCAEGYARFVLENPDSPHVAEALCRLETLETLAANVTARVAPAITPDMRSAEGAARLMNI